MPKKLQEKREEKRTINKMELLCSLSPSTNGIRAKFSTEFLIVIGPVDLCRTCTHVYCIAHSAIEVCIKWTGLLHHLQAGIALEGLDVFQYCTGSFPAVCSKWALRASHPVWMDDDVSPKSHTWKDLKYSVRGRYARLCAGRATYWERMNQQHSRLPCTVLE